MDINIEIIPYTEENCVCLDYVPGAKIECQKHDSNILIRANPEGFQFLEKLCLTLAQNDTPSGSHIHFDSFDFFDSDNVEITVEKA